MTISGWHSKYLEIVREFNYSRQLDYEASIILDSVMKRTVTNSMMSTLLSDKAVFVVGTGTSLKASIPVLKKFKDTIKIAADSAIRLLMEEDVVPDIAVTDLDGDEPSLKRCNRSGTIFVVHAHGDNISKLHLARNFKNCLGTTQAEPYGDVQNFGGFTDGDRAVFLASHFGARKIILLGMDYDGKIGRFSKTKKTEADTKLRKLEKSRELLEWLSEKTRSELFTCSNPIRGFKKLRSMDLSHDFLE